MSFGGGYFGGAYFGGSPIVVAASNVTATGIASAEAFGTPTVTRGAVTVSPTGIASAEALGTPKVSVTLHPSGIASAEAFGTPSITAGTVTLTAVGIASGEAFGTAVVTPGPVSVNPSGIGSAEAFGTPVVTPGAITLTLSGIASAEAFGTPTLSIVDHILPVGIGSAEAFGTPTIAAETQGHVYTEFALDALTGAVDLSTDTIKAMPLSAYTVGTTRDTAKFTADVLAVASEAAGGSYVAGGVALAGVSFTKVGHSYVMSCAPIDFSTTDIVASHILFLDAAGGSDATNRVILFWDLGGTQSLLGITPSADGVLVALAT